MEMNLKIKVFMKVGIDDEINEKDAAISYAHFLLNIFGGPIQANFKISSDAKREGQHIFSKNDVRSYSNLTYF